MMGVKLLMKGRGVVSGLLVAAFAGIVAFGWHWQKPSTPVAKPGAVTMNRVVNVRTVVASLQPTRPSLKLVGKLVANQSVLIKSEVSARITHIAVHSGQTVAKGQTLIELDDGKQRAVLAEQQASLLDEQRKLSDMTQLFERGAITQSERVRQQALVAQGAARVASAAHDLQLRTLKAPFAGVVGLIDWSNGAQISSSDELLQLADLTRLRLDLAVPERYLSLLHEGMQVKAVSQAWPDEPFHGQVVRLDSRVLEQTQSIKARVMFDNSQQRLKPGMQLNIELALTPRTQVQIPAQAVEYVGPDRFVYRLNADHTVKRIAVILGELDGEHVWVNEGLKAGERVVFEGLVSIRDGMKVRDLAGVQP